MAGIGSIYQQDPLYKDASQLASDRLLSARSGVSNILANVHKDAGWAQPGIAMMQGQEAARIGSENERMSQKQEFFTTFGKLLVANGGAAAKFWTEHAKSVGIDVPLDSIDAKPQETIVSFKNGIIAIINKVTGEISTPDGQGGFRPWIDADTAKFEGYANKELDIKKSNKPDKAQSDKDKLKNSLLNSYIKAKGGQSITVDPYNQMQLKKGGWSPSQSLDEQLKAIERVWEANGFDLTELKGPSAPAEPAPAPALGGPFNNMGGVASRYMGAPDVPASPLAPAAPAPAPPVGPGAATNSGLRVRQYVPGKGFIN